MDYSNELSVLDAGLRFLQRLGFDGPKVHMETSKLIGDSLVLIYDSKEAERQVDVYYCGTQHGRPAGISVFVSANSGKHFSLKNWLVANGMAKAIEFSTLDCPGLSEHQFIERFCQNFEKICDRELREILAGRAWQDIPFDWKGYR